jgi:hypothetical protein
MLPVAPELSGLLPGRGLRRGSTVAVAAGRSAPAGGGTSLMLALLAAASRDGSWCAVVGMPTLGALAAAESGVALERLALVPHPGPDWPTVVAALIDGVDVVVAAVPGPVPAGIAGRLAARARQRGSVLVPFGDWAGADLTLRVGAGRWEGLGAGRGRLRRREVTVVAEGRGAAARPREITLWMPGVTTRAAIPPVRSAGEEPVVRETVEPDIWANVTEAPLAGVITLDPWAARRGAAAGAVEPSRKPMRGAAAVPGKKPVRGGAVEPGRKPVRGGVGTPGEGSGRGGPAVGA